MLKRHRLLSWFLCGCILFPYSARAADFPLYVAFTPFGPPNLFLRTTRIPTPFFNPSQTTGTTINYDFAVTTTLTLIPGPIPITLGAFAGGAGCGGVSNVQVSLDYIIGGVTTNVGTQTQTVNVTAVTTVPLFNFNGISATQPFILNPGDTVRLQITNLTAGNTFCLVNEFPVGGTDADASRVVLQTGPLLSFTKLGSVVRDPINGTSNPKAIPGATIRYTLIVTNDPIASDVATDAVVTDEIPASTTYTFGDNTIQVNGVMQTDADDSPTDETDFGVTTPNTITSNLGIIAVGTSSTLTYDVILD